MRDLHSAALYSSLAPTAATDQIPRRLIPCHQHATPKLGIRLPRSLTQGSCSLGWNSWQPSQLICRLPVQELYAAEGGRLVQQGSLPQAEALYLAFEDPDAALHMWHAHARYDEAVALVTRVRPVGLDLSSCMPCTKYYFLVHGWPADGAGSQAVLRAAAVEASAGRSWSRCVLMFVVHVLPIRGQAEELTFTRPSRLQSSGQLKWGA